MNDTKKTPVKKGRSPSYPGLDIEAALQRARDLYAKIKRHQSNVVVAVSHWGYTFGSGASNLTLASLKKYGFLEESGSGKDRKVCLTDLAERIIIDNRSNPDERNKLIIEAALKPKIHEKLFDKYEYSLLPDGDLIFELISDFKFTESGARELISQYRRTLAFIETIKSDKISSNSGSEGQEQGEDGAAHTPAPQQISPKNQQGEGGNVQTIQIPMLEGIWPSLTAQFPMTDEDWTYMMGVLTTMKPKLVKPKNKNASQGKDDTE